MLESRHLFTKPDLESDADNARRFAEMISLLGPPPVEFLRRSEESLKFWDENGMRYSYDTIYMVSLLTSCR